MTGNAVANGVWLLSILYNQMSELAVKAKSLTDETDLVISLLLTEANDMWIVIERRCCGVCDMRVLDDRLMTFKA